MTPPAISICVHACDVMIAEYNFLKLQQRKNTNNDFFAQHLMLSKKQGNIEMRYEN